MLLYFPHPALHRLPLLRNARPLTILAITRVVSMVAGIPTSPIAEAFGLLASDLITAAPKAPPSVTIDKAYDRAIRSAIWGISHAANCVKISVISIPIVLNSSNGVMV